MAYSITDECLSCGQCAAVCPAGAITESSNIVNTLGNSIFVIEQEECLECGACVDNCPICAIVEE